MSGSMWWMNMQRRWLILEVTQGLLVIPTDERCNPLFDIHGYSTEDAALEAIAEHPGTPYILFQEVTAIKMV